MISEFIDRVVNVPTRSLVATGILAGLGQRPMGQCLLTRGDVEQ